MVKLGYRLPYIWNVYRKGKRLFYYYNFFFFFCKLFLHLGAMRYTLCIRTLWAYRNVIECNENSIMTFRNVLST